jgi:hypothetical protein
MHSVSTGAGAAAVDAAAASGAMPCTRAGGAVLREEEGAAGSVVGGPPAHTRHGAAQGDIHGATRPHACVRRVRAAARVRQLGCAPSSAPRRYR